MRLLFFSFLLYPDNTTIFPSPKKTYHIKNGSKTLFQTIFLFDGTDFSLSTTFHNFTQKFLFIFVYLFAFFLSLLFILTILWIDSIVTLTSIIFEICFRSPFKPADLSAVTNFIISQNFEQKIRWCGGNVIVSWFNTKCSMIFQTHQLTVHWRINGNAQTKIRRHILRLIKLTKHFKRFVWIYWQNFVYGWLEHRHDWNDSW